MKFKGMIILYIIGVIVILCIGILVLPLKIKIDSREKTYQAGIPGYFRVRLNSESSFSSIDIRIFFFSFQKQLKVSKPGKSKKNQNRTKTSGGRKKIAPKKLIMVGRKFFKAFSVKYLRAEIDTGDFPLNAQLVPVASLLNNRRITMQINFENQNSLKILVHTYLYKLLWISIQTFLFTKNKNHGK